MRAQIDSAADKAAQEATAKFGANVGDQVSVHDTKCARASSRDAAEQCKK